jgi:hypothetical protein
VIARLLPISELDSMMLDESDLPLTVREVGIAPRSVNTPDAVLAPVPPSATAIGVMPVMDLP